MALNFPDNPSNGETYIASNGVEYTYDAATDTWTGALATAPSYWTQNDDSDIYVTDTNSNVGIGLTAPTSALEVVDSLGGGIISNVGDTQATDINKGIHVRNGDATDTFNVSYKGQGYFAGNLGIGVASPTDALSVTGDGTFSGDGTFGGTVTLGTLNLDNLNSLP